MKNISVKKLIPHISHSETCIIDVREVDEWNTIRLPSALLLPCSSIEHRVSEIDRSRDLYILCKSGGRSGQVCEWLSSLGISATNIDGGIKALYREAPEILEK